MCCVKQDPVHNMLGVRPSTILSLPLWSPSLFLLFEKATDLTTRAEFSVLGKRFLIMRSEHDALALAARARAHSFTRLAN